MRRGALINRSHQQLALAHRILRRQPLVDRLTRHQQLPLALGLAGLPGLPMSQAHPVSPVLTGTIPPLSTVGWNFPAAFVSQTEDGGEAMIEALPGTGQEHEASIPVQPLTEMAEQVEVNQTGREAVPEVETAGELEDIHETEAGPEALTRQREDVQPSSPAASASVAIPLVSEDVSRSVGEFAQPGQHDQTGRQDERLTGDEAVPLRTAESVNYPVETVRPRRPHRRIEELPTLPGQRNPSEAQATKKSKQEPQCTIQASKEEQRPSMKPGRENGIDANELFAPTNTDRSPQAWLARLMGKSLPAQEEVAADAETATETETEADVLPASRGIEAPVDQGTAIPQPRQSGEQSLEVEGQEQKQGQAQTVSATRFDLLESRMSSGEAQVTGQQSHRQQEETRQLQGQGQPPVERSTALRVVSPLQGMAAGTRNPQARQPEQLSSRTRRFLQPLLGIDPASVQIHRDAQSAQLADAYNADAVTVGDNVELSASAASETAETPQTLGLLAHELTHVARQRDPGFIPSIMQAQQDMGDGPTGAYIVGPPLAGGLLGKTVGDAGGLQGGTVGDVGGLHGGVVGDADNLGTGGERVSAQNLATADEETLALQVERQVRQVAREQVRQRGAIIPPAQNTISALPTASATPVEPFETREAMNDPWGGLPAPWEPLPGWLSVPVPPTTPEQGVSSSPVPTAYPAQEMNNNSSNHQANGTVEVAVQRAGRERSIDEDDEQTPSSSESASEQGRAPEPDLDELARQVYSILRNRLEVERRRHR